MTLIKVDPKEFGLEETKAAEIQKMFTPMLEEMVVLEKEYNKLSKLEINDETVASAKELRLKYVKVRTGTATIHRDLKAFYLKGGRFVDGWKNAQVLASEGIEEKLMSIEKHFENQEKERIAKLDVSRREEILKYVESELLIPEGLGAMLDAVWDNYLAGAKANFEAREKAQKEAQAKILEEERKAEEERQVKLKAEAEERERVQKENVRLTKEAEERDKQQKIESEQRAKAEKERLAKEEKERNARQAELDAAEKRQREIEAELQKERDAKAQAEAEEKASVESELKKGDSDKIKDLVSDLEALKNKYEFKSKTNKDLYIGVGELLGKVQTYINSKN